MVCRNNVQLTNQRSCEKALLQGQEDYYELCDVRMIKSEELVLPKQVKHNEYVYSTQGETISKRCVNKVPSEMVVKTGVYLISVEQNCVYESRQWRLFHIRQVEDRVTLTWQLIDIPDVKIHAILRKQTELFQSRFGVNKQLGHVQVIKLKPLSDDDYDINDVPDILNANLNIIDVCILLLILPLYVLFVYKLYVYCRMRLLMQTEASRPPAQDEATTFISLYPTLPNLTNDNVESLQISMSELRSSNERRINEDECERDEHEAI